MISLSAGLLLVFSSLPLFDGLGLVIEEPAEPEVEASAEQHGVEEDAEDEDLLWNSDEVIIHCELDPDGGLLQCPLRGAGGAGHQTITTRLSFCFPFIPVQCPGYDRNRSLHHIESCVSKLQTCITTNQLLNYHSMQDYTTSQDMSMNEMFKYNLYFENELSS